SNIKRNGLVPPVIIEQTLVDKKEVGTLGNIQVPVGRGDLEFHYTALSMVAPEKVFFKYKLEGFDSDWIDAGTRREAFYTNIPPGDYRFTVIACNNDGVWSQDGSSIQFYLKPHFYQTYWFYALCGLAVLLMIGTWYRLRVASLKVREK